MAKPYKAYNTLKSSRPEKIKPVRVYLIFLGKKLLQPPKATKSFAFASERAITQMDSRDKVFPLQNKIINTNSSGQNAYQKVLLGPAFGCMQEFYMHSGHEKRSNSALFQVLEQYLE